MTHPCLEIVTYKIAPDPDADHDAELARAEAMTRAQALSGFAGWLPLCGKPETRADLVIWASEADALNAGRVVGSAPEFAPFRDTITAISAMGHFALPVGALPLMQGGDGVEMGRFRLRAGVTDAAIRAAHEAMIAAHLSHQSGWRGQRLLRMQDGTYLDLPFAQTQDMAQEICASWVGIAECDAFLAMIEPISMEFGAIV